MPRNYDYELELLKKRQEDELNNYEPQDLGSPPIDSTANELYRLAKQKDEIKRSLAMSRRPPEQAVNEPDVLPQQTNATEQHPGVFKALSDRTGKFEAKPLQTKVEQYPEYKFADDVEDEIIGKPGMRMPPLPKLNVPEFSYPEFSETSGENSGGDTRAKRLLAYLNMAGNDFVRGATGFKPDNGVAEGILNEATQIDKNKLAKKDRLDNYIKNKYSAQLEHFKLKNEAEKYRNDAVFKNYLLQLKAAQLGSKTQRDKYSDTVDAVMGKEIPAWIEGGMENGEYQKVLRLQSLVTNYLQQSMRDNPGMKDLIVKDFGNFGKSWFNLKHSGLSSIKSALEKEFLPQLNETFRGAITEGERRAFFDSILDYSIDPQANAAKLQATINDMKRKVANRGKLFRQINERSIKPINLETIEDKKSRLKLVE